MRKLLILAVLMCGSVCAFADPVEFTFVGWNGGNWENGYPYYIMESSGSPTVLYVMCDDYFHGGEPGQQWEANITDLGSGNIQLDDAHAPPPIFPTTRWCDAVVPIMAEVRAYSYGDVRARKTGSL